MYSVKKNILQTVALLKEYGIKHIVVSPGSRNAPLLQSFSQDPFFEYQVVVDERNAAFHAIGIIQALRQPVAICCTSGTALLNYAPAVAEAFYQQLPLIVISADRSPEWIGQMDGQTLPQNGVFNTLVKKSVQLHETDEWYCNRLINEALIACTSNSPGPVHINIPISEPLFDYSIEKLPEVRRINFPNVKKVIDIKPYSERWNNSKKKLIIVGQHHKSEQLTRLLESLVIDKNCVVITEHLSNCVSPLFISDFDSTLSNIGEMEQKSLSPDLVITLGGHIVSKNIKHFLRKNKPENHWHLSNSGEVVDLFQSLTDLIESDIISFISDILNYTIDEKARGYSNDWKKYSKNRNILPPEFPFSDILVVNKFLQVLPNESALHLANSSVVRNVQLFTLDKSTNVYCNRGTNGIESSLASTIGFASVSPELVFLIIGDLSFFYAISALWNISHIKNLRILLINNNGGGIFHLLPKLNKSSSLTKLVAAEHNTKAEKWVEASGFDYLFANDCDSLEKQLNLFVDTKIEKSIVLEIKTEIALNKKSIGKEINFN